jgi:hypothetical protein
MVVIKFKPVSMEEKPRIKAARTAVETLVWVEMEKGT